MTDITSHPAMAYLVIREGGKWTDVFRLIPGQTVSIGRAPSNRIVLKDDRCSRNHAEIFFSDGNWLLRDLESRNGTRIGEELLDADHLLMPGEIVRIGRSQLAFVYDLSLAFAEGSTISRANMNIDRIAVDDAQSVGNSGSFEGPPTITHRRGQTRFLNPDKAEDAPVSQVSKSAAKLCRLAFDMAKAQDTTQLAEVALAGLFESIPVDAGAVLLSTALDMAEDDTSKTAKLEIAATKTNTARRYMRVSSFLSQTVFKDGEAVLARNVLGDSNLGTVDSKGEIHSTSVICAPIRKNASARGLIHLYSTDPNVVLDPEHLEFTLAVSDTFAVALENLSRREALANDLSQIKNEYQQLKGKLRVQTEIVGKSTAMSRVIEDISRAAPSRATVLIQGESGVGKELVAKAVHYSSPRAKNAFVCLNCAALSESLLESELFGHEKGSFTGASDRKTGKFEAAHMGTLMLDEIGEMSPTIQAKFLRVLEGHQFERVGGSEPVKVDVRVIAATNRDLEKDVIEGRFRRDLFFRLRVIEISVPPLRRRQDDIHLLAHRFLVMFTHETARPIRGFTARAMERMLQYRWPGNVRELKNVVERAILLARGELIDEEDLLVSNIATAGDTNETYNPRGVYQAMSLADMERKHILATLNATNWNKSQTANILGIERSTLDRKIRRYDLNREELNRPETG